MDCSNKYLIAPQSLSVSLFVEIQLAYS